MKFLSASIRLRNGNDDLTVIESVAWPRLEDNRLRALAVLLCVKRDGFLRS